MYDLIIIGAGPGGYPAAVEAAKAGLKVAVIEKADLGGVCLNYGCIPTKALLKAAEILEKLKHAKEWGIEANYTVDIKQMVKQSREGVKKLTNGIAFLFKSSKVELINGNASIKKTEDGKITILCNGKELIAKNLIVASGATARNLPGAPDSKSIWSIKDAMLQETIPTKLAIIGAGAIGVEFASFYNTLGTKISIFEMAPSILPGTDAEIAQTMHKHMEKSGIEIKINTKIDKIEEKNGKISVQYAGKIEEFDALLPAIGVIPNTKDFPSLDVETSYFKTNQLHQTFSAGKLNKNIFAIGDCASGPWLAHKATAEGLRAVNTILNKKVGKLGAIPMCIYTNPQIASIGETETTLKQKNIAAANITVLKYSFMGNGKAVATGEANGFVKIICDKLTGEILGAHMIGPEVTELIHSIALGMQIEALPEDFINTVFPHPTLSETVFEAFLSNSHS